MIKYQAVLVLSFILLCTLVACQEGPASVAEPVHGSITDTNIRLATPAAYEGGLTTPELRAEIAEATNSSMHAFLKIIEGSANWQEAHSRVQTELAAGSEFPAYIREQIAATYMLRSVLNSGDTETGAHEAIMQYTRLLIDNKSPDGPLLVQALQRLYGQYEEEEIKQLSGRATEGPRHFLEKRRYCEDCLSNLSNEKKEKISSEQEVYLNEVEASLITLDRMAE